MAKSYILSFHDILLRQSDIELLDGPYWLNDTVISFYFEYLEKVVFKESNVLLFVSPEVTQCIKMVNTEDVEIFLDPLGIKEKDYTFFPLNDNHSTASGGSHWSLVVYSKPESCFFHLDSSSTCNHDVAWDFASHLIPYLANGGTINFVNKECPQQSNGYDCGVYVISNTEKLAKCAHNHGQIGSCDMSVKVNPSTKRKEILNIIRNLSNS